MSDKPLISAVRCTRCGKLHAVDSATYLQVTANIIVGQNRPDSTYIPPAIYCIGDTSKPSCLEIHLIQKRGGSGKEERRLGK